ncbi:MAG: insulinase family protein [Bacteroidetes bacterium]|nr:MAG: insulinase family protein [Bacteroidota bacterium]
MVKFDKFILKNGLTVLVHHDSNTPMTAMNLIYKVGSRDEHPNKTGFAHLFEHLMFGGSINIPKYDEPLQKAGGENNAFTNSDFTDYYLTIPTSNLETAFWLESDRMLSLAFTPKSLEVQRQVVIEEFKQNYLNQPYGDVYLLLKPLTYKKHPYRWNTIGKDVNHIQKATMEDVKTFYEKYYRPDNAILSIAGNVETEYIKTLAEKWFEPIPAGNMPKNIYPVEPEQISSRTLTVERPVPQNAIYMAWPMSARTDERFYCQDLISDILSNGNSSRLFQNLVKKDQLFSDINAFVTGDIDKGLFIVSGKLINGTSGKKAESAIQAQLNILSSKLVREEELQKVKNKIESNLIFSKLSVLNKAMNLAYFEMLGEAERLNLEIGKYRKVNRNQIREEASLLFAENKRNILFYEVEKNEQMQE